MKRGWTDEQRKAAAIRNKKVAETRLKEGPWEKVPKSRKRDRLLFEQDYRCALCSIEEVWNGKPLKFQLDHVSGDRNDNSRENLRLLCPNCHSQTDTWCSKNVSEEGRKRMLDAFAQGRLNRLNQLGVNRLEQITGFDPV